MQKALESIFGPEVMGLVGLVLMAVMIGPKFLTRWRGFRVRQKGPTDCRNRVTGQRFIHIKSSPEAELIDAHAEHGTALRKLIPNRINLFLEFICWILPLLLVITLIPTELHSVYTILLVLTVPMALVGLYTLNHLWDYVLFYQTGMTLRQKFRKKSFDYNSIVEITERKPLFFWMNSSFILHMDDEQLFVLDGSYFKQGDRLKIFFDTLDKRIKTNAMLD